MFSPYTTGLEITPFLQTAQKAGCEENTRHFFWQHLGVGLNSTPNPDPNHPIYASQRVEAEAGNIVSGLFNDKPICGEVMDKAISKDLFLRFPISIPISSDVFSPESESLVETPIKIRFIADLIETYAIFQHFYPYLNLKNADLDNSFMTAASSVTSETSRADFLVVLKKFVESIHDGHGNVSDSQVPFTSRTVPVFFDLVEDQIVVTASAVKEIQIGDIVTKVDGKPAKLVLEDAKSLISGSEQWKTHRALLAEFAWGEMGSLATFTLLRNGEKLVAEIKRDSFPIREFDREDIFSVKEDIVYIDLDRAPMDKISKVLSDVNQGKGLILDLRGYPAGNHEIIRHLIEEPVQSAFFEIPQFIYPDQENIAGYQSARWLLHPKEPKINVPVIIITDARAISYAESVLGIFEHYKLADIVGSSSTAGANGNVNAFTTASGCRVSFTGMLVRKHDESPHHLIGIHPNFETKRTLRGVREGKDELLEKAISLLTRQ